MVCSSCRRRETSDGFKTCEKCREAKRRCYHKKKERIQDEINRYNDYNDYIDFDYFIEKKKEQMQNEINNYCNQYCEQYFTEKMI